MEEIQSTEILDREILEDARKKASRILKVADDTVRSKSADWEDNLSATLGELEKKYARQGKLATDEIMAHLPIDKRRAKAKKVEELLNSAIKTWFADLGRAKVLDLLQKDLEKRLAASDKFSTDSGIRVQIHHLEKKEAEAVLKAALPGKSCAIETIHSVSEYPEIIIETKEVRIYASISKIVDHFLDEKRAELVESLLGQGPLGGQDFAEEN